MEGRNRKRRRNPGQNPTQTTCIGMGQNCETTGLTHQQASQAIRQQQSDCRQGILTGCTVDVDGFP
jgi:hypothetical protein